MIPVMVAQKEESVSSPSSPEGLHHTDLFPVVFRFDSADYAVSLLQIAWYCHLLMCPLCSSAKRHSTSRAYQQQ